MKSKVTFLLTGLVVVFIFMFVISISFGNNPLNNSILGKARLVSVMPEGWAFFTKEPTDPNVYAYRVEGNVCKEINLRNFAPGTYFGVSRDNRIANIELNTVLKTAMKNAAAHYEYKAVDPDELLSQIKVGDLKANKVSVAGKLIPRVEEGDYLFVVKIMRPWTLLHKEPNYKSKMFVCKVSLQKI